MYAAEAHRQHHRERALKLAESLPSDALLSHESATIVWGLPTYDVPAAVQVTRSRGKSVRTSDVAVYPAQLRPDDRAWAEDRPVTSMARTVVDLGRRRPFLHALMTADAALRRGTPRAAFESALRHQWTWPGVRRAMQVVREADVRSESPLESYVRGRFLLLGLPRPDLQRRPVADLPYRVDFSWEQFRLVGEADGLLKYTDDQTGMDPLMIEKVREENLRDSRLEVIRWRWLQAQVADDVFAQRFLRAVERGRAQMYIDDFIRRGLLPPPSANVINNLRKQRTG